MDNLWAFLIGKMINKHLWETALCDSFMSTDLLWNIIKSFKRDRFILILTPEIELNILLSCPDADEKDIFKGPGPTSIMLLLGETTVDTRSVLLYPGQMLFNIELIKIHQLNQILISTIIILKFEVPLSFFFHFTLLTNAKFGENRRNKVFLPIILSSQLKPVLRHVNMWYEMPYSVIS